MPLKWVSSITELLKNNIELKYLTENLTQTELKTGDGVSTTRVPLRHTTMFTYSHATTPLGQSEHTYYL